MPHILLLTFESPRSKFKVKTNVPGTKNLQIVIAQPAFTKFGNPTDIGLPLTESNFGVKYDF